MPVLDNKQKKIRFICLFIFLKTENLLFQNLYLYNQQGYGIIFEATGSLALPNYLILLDIMALKL